MWRILTQEPHSRLSEIFVLEGESFRVLSLLQRNGNPIGVLSVTFSTQHLSQKLREEMLRVVGVTIPILVLAGLGLMLYGRRMVARLRGLQERALAIGRGELGAPMPVSGADEISQLTLAFNQMRSDLAALREQERASGETINSLNVDLSAQLRRVEQLKEQLADENAALREELRAFSSPGGVIGFETGLRHVARQIRQLAPVVNRRLG